MCISGASEPGRAQRIEFASDAWLAMADELLKRLVRDAGGALARERFSICQILTDAPAHLVEGRARTLAWSMVIDGPASYVAKGAITDADYVERAAFRDIEANARIVLAGAPADQPQKTIERGSLAQLREAVGRVLLLFHNELALRTA